MKCAGCGIENTDKARLCSTCGRLLTALRENAGAGGEYAKHVEVPEKEGAAPKGFTAKLMIDHRTIADKIKFDYSHGIRDHTQKALEGVQTLLSDFQT